MQSWRDLSSQCSTWFDSTIFVTSDLCPLLSTVVVVAWRCDNNESNCFRNVSVLMNRENASRNKSLMISRWASSNISWGIITKFAVTTGAFVGVMIPDPCCWLTNTLLVDEDAARFKSLNIPDGFDAAAWMLPGWSSWRYLVPGDDNNVLDDCLSIFDNGGGWDDCAEGEMLRDSSGCSRSDAVDASLKPIPAVFSFPSLTREEESIFGEDASKMGGTVLESLLFKVSCGWWAELADANGPPVRFPIWLEGKDGCCFMSFISLNTRLPSLLRDVKGEAVPETFLEFHLDVSTGRELLSPVSVIPAPDLCTCYWSPLAKAAKASFGSNLVFSYLHPLAS